jgi:hypothetical protein
LRSAPAHVQWITEANLQDELQPIPRLLSVDVLLAAFFPPLDCLLVRISLFSLDFVFGFQELSFLFGRITIELAAQPEQAAEAVLRLIGLTS